MAVIPDQVRFHFARQSSSPWNWYTKPDFQGCALKWSAPKGNVALYIVFRSSESLPSDCCEDLLNGQYDDVVERIDIFKPITRIVDDEIHDKNRYLVLARLDNDDIVWIEDVESFQFSGAAPGENWTYWSNPYGDTPKPKDPCRLDYSTVRVETFCGLEWDYPSQYPDFVGYDLIVCDVPYSPHTGADTDIEAFRGVLSGTRGVTYSLERFVTAVVDNESFLNKFAYYALLVRLPESGRVQIPLRHTSIPFEKGHPFQYLKARPNWGEGRDRMMAAYARWKAQMASGKMPFAESTEMADEEHAEDTAEKVEIEFFQHTPDLSYDSYRKQPDMIGIQFRAKVPDNATILALRATHQPDAAECAVMLRNTLRDGVYESDTYDGFKFTPPSDYIQLVDADCHEKSWYAFALYREETDDFEELSHVKDTTVDFLGDVEGIIQWGNPKYQFENRVLHCFKVEEIQKKTHLSIEFGIIDENAIASIELYRFETKPNWSADRLEDIHQFQLKGEPSLGARYVLETVCHGVVDDVSRCDSTHYYAAVSLDRHGNRMPLTLYSQGNQVHEGWGRLSEISPNEVSDLIDNEMLSYHEALSDMSYRNSESRWDSGDDSNDAASDSSDKNTRTRHSSRYSLDDGTEVEEEYVETEHVSGRSSTKYGRSSRYDWGDDHAMSDGVLNGNLPETRANSSNLNTRSSRASRYSWDDDDVEVKSDSNGRSDFGRRSSSVNERVGRGGRYSWDDDETGTGDVLNGDLPETRASSSNLNTRSSRASHYSWDDDDVEVKSDSNERSDFGRRSSSVNERVSRGGRYSWDDENVERKAGSDDARSDYGRRSSSVNERVGRGGRYSWDDAEVEVESESDGERSDYGRRSSSVNERVGRGGRYSWDDEDVEVEVDGDDQENLEGKPRLEIHETRNSEYAWDDDVEIVDDGSDEDGEVVIDDSREVYPHYEWDNEDADKKRYEHAASDMTRGARRHYDWDDEPKASEESGDEAPSGSSGVNRRTTRGHHYSWDDGDAASKDAFDEELSGSRVHPSSSASSRVTRSSRYSWDDDDSMADSASGDNQSETRVSSSTVSSRVSRSSRYSWDDDDSVADSTSGEDRPETRVSSSTASSRVSRSSRYSWGDDDSVADSASGDNQSETRVSSSSVSSRVSRSSRYSWDDDDSVADSTSGEDRSESRVSSSTVSSRVTRSSRYSWDDDDDALQAEANQAFAEAEELAHQEAERLAQEEEARKAREEAECLAQEEEARKAQEEAERLAREEEERKAREEAERLAREEEERKAREEAERLAREEEERKAREEAERLAREEEERKAREEAERLAHEEEERKAREAAERLMLEEAARLAREEEERLAREEAERLAREEAERLAREEAERLAREEAERLAREEAERLVREEAERKAREAKALEERRAREDVEIVELLVKCRRLLDDGDMQEAYDIVQRAHKSYPENLRLEAFEWNYLR